MPEPRHPYADQPERAYWPKTVRDKHPLDITDWYQKKFSLDGRRIATAGSCFAQHIGRRLRSSGFDFVDTEPAPTVLEPQSRAAFGYHMYSARYGNIYTSWQLLQLFQRAFGTLSPVEDYWVCGDGVVDPFRPTIEPEPFSTVAEMHDQRAHHLACVRQMFHTADVFVFTLGLTEAWCSRLDGAVFPLAPGTVAGTWDSSRYAFANLTYPMVMEDMHEFIDGFQKLQPEGSLLLTVSPVPLVATATTDQVVVATTYSKSVLRAVAGALAAEYECVDYFPSYEIVAASPMGSRFFEPDMREISSHGVDHVMREFFRIHPPPTPTASDQVANGTATPPEEEDVVCDQELLATFGGRQ